MPRRVLLTDYAWSGLDLERKMLSGAGAELVVSPDSQEETLAKLAADVDGIMTCWANVTANVLNAAKQCRIVARLGVGLDNIDVPTATSLGMLVTNIPDYCTIEVAEHTIALLLALARNIAWFDRATRAGSYERKVGPPLRRIEGQTLGIIGYGAIGQAVAQRARGLGLNVLVSTHRKFAEESGITACTREHLLAESDYVSLHVPLVGDNHHLINRAALALMKPTAFLINTARGGLIDQEALAAALAAGRLAGAALDVQDPEPPDLTQPPLNDPRVIVTPHMAFSSRESLENLRTRATQQVIDVLAGKRPENVINQPQTTRAS